MIDSEAYDSDLEKLDAIIKNVYRILLTRSRKEMFLEFSNTPNLEETHRWFHQMLRI